MSHEATVLNFAISAATPEKAIETAKLRAKFGPHSGERFRFEIQSAKKGTFYIKAVSVAPEDAFELT